MPRDARIYVHGCSGESAIWAEALAASGSDIGSATFTGIFVPGLNRTTYLLNDQCRVETFFQTPELSRASAAVKFLPLCYQDVLRRLRTVPIGAALFQVSPPDADGWCSFGPVSDFLAEIWPLIPVRIAHINPNMPRTRGHRGIPWSALTAVHEAAVPLLGTSPDGTDAVSQAIGRHVAAVIPDEATIQIGMGRIPAAILAALGEHRGLRLHSGLIGDGVLELLRRGACADGVAITGGVAIGSPELYDAVSGPAFEFHPVTVTHSAQVLAGLPGLVTINSALAIDLFGQGYAEWGPRGLMSGPGGASDFARGARAAGGLRIIALPSMANGTHRIIDPRTSTGLVSLSRFDIDMVATEHGIADLRGLSHDDRARALIEIADPSSAEELARVWADISRRF